jgi:polyferredoxin
VVALKKGRMWCGNFCPRGSFNDIILSRISHNKAIPRLMRSTSFRITFLIALMGAFAVQLMFAWGDIKEVGSVFARMIIITTGITIVLGIMYSHRAWCVICPMGTMAAWVTKLVNKDQKVSFVKDKCVSCKLCTKACPIGINVLSYKEQGKIDNPDCLKCNECVIKCPKKALKAV